MRHSKKHRVVGHTINLFILLIALGLFIGGIAILWLSTLQIPDLGAFDTRNVAQSTKIYDRTGEILLYDIHDDTRRTEIAFEDISIHIKNATVAIEDAEFYEHFGIKPTAILRAVIANLTPGGLTQGGSTITQQIIKNSILTKDKTITRKLKEWVLAIKLERMLNKEQILNIYLNETPYGGNIYGVEEASKTFFGKDAKGITLAEAAYIAALPQAPSFYSPYGKNRDKLEARQKLVLRKMLEYKFITQKEYDEALTEKITFLEKNTTGIRAPHFVMYVKDYLTKKYGEEMVQQGGLKVITSLDYSIQQKAEKVVADFAPRMEQNFNASNTAMVVIDPRNGDILTMVGSRNYFDQKIDGNFNIATAERQPGSTFKPFVYATAFKKGYTPDTVLFDVKTEFSSECTPDSKPKKPDARCYSPENSDLKYEGPLSIRRALAESRNIPAVKTLYLVGINDAIATAESMGIDNLNDPDRYGLTLTLGGGEVSLLQLTSAYGVFANDGLRNPARAVLKIEDAKGVIIEQTTDQPVQVLDANIARQISDILSDKKVRLPSVAEVVNPIGKTIAAKTGTTNDYRDVWILGYTPSLVVGAWAGKNDNSPMEKKVAGLIITPLWGAFLQDVLKSYPAEEFKKPELPNPDTKPTIRGIWKGGVSYFRDKVSGKVATEFTPQETREEVVFNSVHSILYWVDKSNPLGPIPSNPAADSQFENWEYGVRNWFRQWAAQNPGFEEVSSYTIPQDKDDVHTASNLPKATITTTSPSITKGKPFTVQVTFNSLSPIKKADFFLNEKIIGSAFNPPFSFTYTPGDEDVLLDQNKIRVVIVDTVFNKGEATVTVPLQ